MAAASSSISLPEHIVRAAEVQARVHGVSVEEWVSRTLAERLDAPDGAREYFRRRAGVVQPEDFARVLDAIPSRNPDPGDEL